MQQRGPSPRAKHVKQPFLLKCTDKCDGRGLSTLRDHSLCLCSRGKTKQCFMHKDFNNKYLKEGRVDDGMNILLFI